MKLSMISSVCPPGFVVQFESLLYLFILMQKYICKKFKQTRIDGQSVQVQGDLV